MLPFVFLDPQRLLGLSAFALVVPAGLLLWQWAARRLVPRFGRSVEEYADSVYTIAPFAVVFAHVFDVAFYHPSTLLQAPVELFKIWNGFSSFGGFLGTAIGSLFWLRYDLGSRGMRPTLEKRAVPVDPWPFLEVNFATYPLAHALGRLGCALVHDHPGLLTTSPHPLALAWPTGPDDGVHRVLGPLHIVTGGSTSRFDLGLLEMLFLALLSIVLVVLARKQRPLGTFTGITCMSYAPVRFALDFLRATDVPGADLRHAGLTFAQWTTIPLFLFGVVGLRRVLRKGASSSRVAATPAVTPR